MNRGTRMLALIGAVSIVSTMFGLVVLILSVRHGFSARDQPSALEAIIARAVRSWSIPSAAKGLKSPALVTSDLLSSARAHWADHCASCHGNDGSSDTVTGRSLYPKAPDMRAPTTQKLTDGELYYVIENGIRLTGMPAWGSGGYDDKESWALVAFIRHLPGLTDSELAEMRGLNPKSPEELREDREEEEFLKGTAATASQSEQHHHH